MSERPVLSLTVLGWSLAIPVLVLSMLGLVSIHATDRSIDSAALTAARPPAAAAGWLERAVQAVGVNTTKQAFYLASGVAIMLLMMRLDFRRIGFYTFPVYWLVVLSLAALVLDRWIDLPLIPVRRDVRRWIELGVFTLQPSEFVKVALILALARYLRFRKSYRRLPGLIPPFLLTLLPMVLILKQPDLGTLLMLLPVLFSMIFIAGARLWHLAAIVGLGCATLPFFYAYGMQEYQKQRVEVLVKQNVADERWHMGPGYQLRQSKIALGTGGVWGQGYGGGSFVQRGLLPEEHNDFIFAIIGNQWGLAGCAIIILAYVVIVVCGLEVALVTNDPFGRLLAVGVVVMIVAQALLNVSMTIGLAPITGMTLPFVSYGGSSLWANFAALGLLLSVAQRRPMLIARPPFEHSD